MAQENTSNLRVKKISTQLDTIQIDSLSLAPNSIKITGIDTNTYRIDYASGTLIWLENLSQDSVEITYRVWPIQLTAPYAHKEVPVFVKDESGVVNPFSFQGTNYQTNTFGNSQIDKSGSISRGVLFGNNQNLGINSNLNLQLSGQLTPKIGIKAVISDNNIPIQPDGNTQLLQDFDQVYVQLFTDQWKLVAGDFRINNPKSHFLTYDKRLRGGGFSMHTQKSASQWHTFSANAALSRGKFSRNIIQGTEGSQGPYRLVGAENEGFIIILSGTEEVYIDGQKLVRGQENDYIIDYNKSEIVFTAKQPITKDKRIIVEFQYSAQAYSRSLIAVSDEFKQNKWTWNFNLYSEQDAKNQPLLQDLTPQNKQLLSQIGDNINQAVVPAIQEVEFSNDRVLYKLLVDPVTQDSIFEYSTHPDSARYQLSFSNVGLGNGNYTEIQSTANGRVFEYIAPVNNQSQGSYSPVILLVTPKRKQMFTASTQYQYSKNTVFKLEGVVTNNDINTFSELGNQNNVGGGFLLGFENKKVLTADTIAPWVRTTSITYENRTDNFEEIQRYRSVEFDRDWNIRDQKLTGMQHVPTAGISFSKKKLGSLGYEFKSFITGKSYQGYRHQ